MFIDGKILMISQKKIIRKLWKCCQDNKYEFNEAFGVWLAVLGKYFHSTFSNKKELVCRKHHSEIVFVCLMWNISLKINFVTIKL